MKTTTREIDLGIHFSIWQEKKLFFSLFVIKEAEGLPALSLNAAFTVLKTMLLEAFSCDMRS